MKSWVDKCSRRKGALRPSELNAVRVGMVWYGENLKFPIFHYSVHQSPAFQKSSLDKLFFSQSSWCNRQLLALILFLKRHGVQSI